MSLPGTWLLAQALKYLDKDIFDSAVAPTLADMQYEVLAAPTTRLRWLARVRGYGAFVRLLFLHGFIWRSPMRRPLIVLALGTVGSAVLMTVWSLAPRGPAFVAGFFLMAVLAPIVLRVLRVGTSYGQMFADCMGLGMIMGTVLLGWIVLVDAVSVPWYGYVLSYLFLTGCVALGSVFAAAVAWKPLSGADPTYRRRLLQVASAALVCVACFIVVGLSLGGSRGVPNVLGWATLLGFAFAAVAIVVYLPLLLSVKRLINVRPALALVGAMLFPIPLLAFPLLQGRLARVWPYWVQNPDILFWGTLPYVVAGATLGWLLAEPSRRAMREAS